MNPLAPSFVFEARIRVGDPIIIGARRMIPITSGLFCGPRLAGVANGITEIHARYVLKTDDGDCIGVTNRGLRHRPESVMLRIAAGEWVDPSEYKFRTSPVFAASAARHEWLARGIFVAAGECLPNEMVLLVWEF